MRPTIGVIGLWHLGCVISAVWSKLGSRVIGFDYDKERVKHLKAGRPPVYEPGLEESLQKVVRENFLSFSDTMETLSQCDFVFISYDTPVREDDSSDTTILEKSVADLGPILKDKAIVIVSSQTPVGFCSMLRRELKRSKPTLELTYSPENLRLGEAIACYENPDRVIIGAANEFAEKECISLFQRITPNVLTMSLESAEMVKHGINSFLAASIVFANHLADICEAKEATISDVVKGIKSDPRIGSKAYLAPGIGFSGGTLGRDLKVLDRVNDERKGFATLFGEIHRLNSKRKESIRAKVEHLLNGCKGKTIGVLGVTYKPGTSTLRRSLPLEIVELLLKSNSIVRVFDPKADFSELSYKPRFSIVKSIADVCVQADMLLLLTEWSEFKEFNWAQVAKTMRRPIFFDTKNMLQKEPMNKLGFQYHSIGNSL